MRVESPGRVVLHEWQHPQQDKFTCCLCYMCLCLSIYEYLFILTKRRSSFKLDSRIEWRGLSFLFFLFICIQILHHHPIIIMSVAIFSGSFCFISRILSITKMPLSLLGEISSKHAWAKVQSQRICKAVSSIASEQSTHSQVSMLNFPRSRRFLVLIMSCITIKRKILCLILLAHFQIHLNKILESDCPIRCLYILAQENCLKFHEHDQESCAFEEGT